MISSTIISRSRSINQPTIFISHCSSFSINKVTFKIEVGEVGMSFNPKFQPWVELGHKRPELFIEGNRLFKLLAASDYIMKIGKHNEHMKVTDEA